MVLHAPLPLRMFILKTRNVVPALLLAGVSGRYVVPELLLPQQQGADVAAEKSVLAATPSRCCCCARVRRLPGAGPTQGRTQANGDLDCQRAPTGRSRP